MTVQCLHIWQLKNNGNVFFGYRNVTFIFYATEDSNLDKYDSWSSRLPITVTSLIRENSLSRTNNVSGVIIVTRTCILLLLLNDSHIMMLAGALKSLDPVINSDRAPNRL